MSDFYSLFSVFGIEAEYMVVDKESLKVKPIADKILQKLNHGEICNELSLGKASWSNELVNHVLEIKCTEPEKSIFELDKVFYESILQINKELDKHHCILMPSAMHPWFDPNHETMLWPHGSKEIYAQYDKVFNCKGHGWSNLQSVHINLPYANQKEFRMLHTAIRCVLPLIPFLAASSPYFEGQKGPLADNRLSFYERNQAKVPAIIGNIIPEVIHTHEDYHQLLEKIYKDIAPYDQEKILQQPWLNSRAAIVKCEYQAIEIRLMDIQESSYMDFCLIHFIVAIIHQITSSTEKLNAAEKLSDKMLRAIYEDAKKYTPQENFSDYFAFFGLSECKNLSEFASNLIEKNLRHIPDRYHQGLQVIKTQGNLATRLIQKPLDPNVYKLLIKKLATNGIYEN